MDTNNRDRPRKAVALLVPLDRPRLLDRLIAEGLATPRRVAKRSRGPTASVIAYFDTSAVVPLIISEASTERCTRLWNESSRVVSVRLLYPEARAALAKARRMGRLTSAQLAQAVQELNSIISEVDHIEVTADLAQAHDLRGHDAVHLAATMALADGDLVVVTGDADLAAAAAEIGIAVCITSA